MWPSDVDEPNRPFPVYGEQQQQNQQFGGQQQQGKPTTKSNTNDAINMHTKHSLFYVITLATVIITAMF